MAKNKLSENKQNQDLDASRSASNKNYNDFNSETRSRSNDQYNYNTGLRDELRNKYSNPNSFMPPGMRNQNRFRQQGNFGAGPNMASNTGDDNTPINGWGGPGNTGGGNNEMGGGNNYGGGDNGWFDLPGDANSDVAGFGGDFGSARTGYQNMADTGGAADFNEARDNYRNLTRTGGIDADAIRKRANAQIPAFYSAYKNSAQRRANVQGGYSPGFDAQQAEMARQSGREGFEANRQVEGDIASRQQQGILAGASGEAGIASQISGNRLSGLGGLTNIASTEGSLGAQRAGMLENAKSRRLDAQMHLADMRQRGELEQAQGMSNLYGQENSNYNQSRGDYLQGLGGQSNSDLNNLNSRRVKKPFDWKQAVGTGLGIGTGLFGGPGGAGIMR